MAAEVARGLQTRRATSKLNERTENVYENKEQGQKVTESASAMSTGMTRTGIPTSGIGISIRRGQDANY